MFKRYYNTSDDSTPYVVQTNLPLESYRRETVSVLTPVELQLCRDAFRPCPAVRSLYIQISVYSMHPPSIMSSPISKPCQ